MSKLISKARSRRSNKLMFKSKIRFKNRHRGLKKGHKIRLKRSKDSSTVILDPIPPMGFLDLLVLLRTRPEIYPEVIP